MREAFSWSVNMREAFRCRLGMREAVGRLGMKEVVYWRVYERRCFVEIMYESSC
jgi:hypothetical protein